MTSEEFKKLGYKLIDWIAEVRGRVEDYPVLSQAQPGFLRSQMPSTPPTKPEGFGQIEQQLEALLPGLTHFQSPNFYGWFPSNSPLHSVLADIVATGLGQVGISWQSSPALSELEQVMMDWMRQMLGLPPEFSGVIQDTASTGTLVAMLTAREKYSNHSQNSGGLQAVEQPLVAYVSDQAHSSVPKAALLAGFGRDNLRLIPTDSEHAMRMDLLEEAIQQDIAAGRRPCILVAAVGTTTTTAVDSVAQSAVLAQKYALWLHVDAAMAGSAMILPECRALWQGIEAADSIVINPHKWLGVAFDCSLYFVQDPQTLVQVMSTNPSYLQGAQDGLAPNYRDWGIPLGRRFRALKIWFALLDQGVEGHQTRLRRDLGNAQWLAQQVDAAPGWKRLAPVPLQTVCLRYEPEGVSGADLDRHTLGWVNRINQSGKAYLTPAILKGRWMVRVSIGAEPTERHHIEALWKTMREAAENDVQS